MAPTETSPDAFTKQVRHVMARMYDPVFLQRHPFARLAAGPQTPPHRAGGILRQHLEAAIEHLRPAANVDPLHRAWRPYRLMQLRYVEARDAPEVQSELGLAKTRYYVDHDHALQAVAAVLAERWRQGALTELPSAPEPATAQPALALGGGSLPYPFTSFIGRETEVEELLELLRPALAERSMDAARLVTLVGTAGSGKTRLAIEVGLRLQAAGAHVHFVPLADVADAELVVPAVAHTLGILEDANQPLRERLKLALGGQPMILLLDNFEQVTGAAAELLDVLQGCPQLRLLVTSREPLGIYGERQFAVAPLPVPPMTGVKDGLELRLCPSYRLFVERATAVNRGFSAAGAAAPAIADLCRKLDGLPLAIELAAARTKLLAPSELKERLEQRLSLLDAGAGTRPARHQTLEAAISWSYDLLTPAERLLFQRLAVFSGGWTLDAAEQVCSEEGISREEVLDLLWQLINRSLIVADTDERGTTRYRLLETLQRYARERLQVSGEAARMGWRHACYVVDFVEAEELRMTGGEQARWLDDVELEHDNLRAALAWCLDPANAPTAPPEVHPAELALRICNATVWFWFVRGYGQEGCRWTLRALEAGQSCAPQLRGRALAAASGLSAALNGYSVASEFGEMALEVAEEVPPDLPHRWSATEMMSVRSRIQLAACLALSYAALFSGDVAGAEVQGQRWLRLAQEARHRWYTGFALQLLGQVAAAKGLHGQATELYRQSLALMRELGDPLNTGLVLYCLALSRVSEGGLEEAARLLSESADRLLSIRAKGHAALSVSKLAMVSLLAGDLSKAKALFWQALGLQREVADRLRVAECLSGFGAVALAEGRPQQAALLSGSAQSLLASISARFLPAEQAQLERLLAQTRTMLGDEAFERELSHGLVLSVEAAIELAQEIAATPAS